MKGSPEAYAGFVWVRQTGERPTFTVGRSYLSDEIMKITEASAESFETKRKALLHGRRRDRHEVGAPSHKGADAGKCVAWATWRRDEPRFAGGGGGRAGAGRPPVR